MIIFPYFLDKPYFATAFEPTEGAMIVAHHMRLFSCAPGKFILEKENANQKNETSQSVFFYFLFVF